MQQPWLQGTACEWQSNSTCQPASSAAYSYSARGHLSGAIPASILRVTKLSEQYGLLAVALDIVNSIFQRNPPEPERESGASTDKATTEAEAIEKRARVRMQVQADSLLKDLLDENSTAESNHAEAMPDI